MQQKTQILYMVISLHSSRNDTTGHFNRDIFLKNRVSHHAWFIQLQCFLKGIHFCLEESLYTWVVLYSVTFKRIIVKYKKLVGQNKFMHQQLFVLRFFSRKISLIYYPMITSGAEFYSLPKFKKEL